MRTQKTKNNIRNIISDMSTLILKENFVNVIVFTSQYFTYVHYYAIIYVNRILN